MKNINIVLSSSDEWEKLLIIYVAPHPPLTDYQIYVIGGFGKFESFATLEKS